jgi:diguanylate cyclase (GGDEF)-like protein
MAKRLLERTLIVQAPFVDDRVAAVRQGTLTVLTGSSMGLVLVLSKARSILGRGDSADLRLDEPGISRAHACLYRNGDQYEIEDLESSNGTFIDANRIQVRAGLHDGARISLGSTLLRFGMQDEVEQVAAKRMHDLSVRDGLTGLYNRRHLDERLAAEFAFALRHSTTLALILIDIDHFKRINDERGHPAGDAVLKGIAGALNSCVRVEDLVARHGGEEFAVLARGVDLTGAKAFAERIRSTIARTLFEHDGASLRVTASLGVAHNQADSAMSTTSALLAYADQALYAAKHEGRNRVCAAWECSSHTSASADHAKKPRDPSRARKVDTAPLVMKPEVPSPTIADRKERKW